ncbi:MAG: haloacid dehalogenase [Acidimicrobiia bacterium]
MTERAEAIAAAGSAARAALEATHQAREITLPASRAAIRACAVAIRAVQRHEFEDARAHIADAAAQLDRAAAATADQGSVRHAGFLQDAYKEYAEANLTLAFIEGGPLPTAEDLGVDAPAYLNGMAEAASELRRQVLDLLRAGDADRAEELFGVMDDVYALLVTVDYPDAVTGGLRRSTDALRAVLERTRGDVTNATVAARFQAAVERTQRA